jgi:hypothetical protein
MTLEEWDHKVGHHLRMIEGACRDIEAHVQAMEFQPTFSTIAFEEMTKAEEFLRTAQDRVREARTRFEGKPYVR